MIVKTGYPIFNKMFFLLDFFLKYSLKIGNIMMRIIGISIRGFEINRNMSVKKFFELSMAISFIVKPIIMISTSYLNDKHQEYL